MGPFSNDTHGKFTHVFIVHFNNFPGDFRYVLSWPLHLDAYGNFIHAHMASLVIHTCQVQTYKTGKFVNPTKAFSIKHTWHFHALQHGKYCLTNMAIYVLSIFRCFAVHHKFVPLLSTTEIICNFRGKSHYPFFAIPCTFSVIHPRLHHAYNYFFAHSMTNILVYTQWEPFCKTPWQLFFVCTPMANLFLMSMWQLLIKA